MAYSSLLERRKARAGDLKSYPLWDLVKDTATYVFCENFSNFDNVDRYNYRRPGISHVGWYTVGEHDFAWEMSKRIAASVGEISSLSDFSQVESQFPALSKTSIEQMLATIENPADGLDAAAVVSLLSDMIESHKIITSAIQKDDGLDLEEHILKVKEHVLGFVSDATQSAQVHLLPTLLEALTGDSEQQAWMFKAGDVWGIRMFREFVTTKTPWSITDESLVGRPEVLVLLIQAFVRFRDAFINIVNREDTRAALDIDAPATIPYEPKVEAELARVLAFYEL